MADPAQTRLFGVAEGYYQTKALLGLWRLGFLDAAIRDEKVDVDGFAAEHGLDPALLRSLVGYLTVREYLEPVDGAVRLTELGRASIPYFGYLPMLVGAYEPIFAGLEDVLTGAKVYGENLRRAEHELVGGLSAMEEHLLARLTELTAGIDVHGVLDLGCGSAQMLSKVLQRFPHARGVGVDWEEAACAEARRRLSAEGLAGRSTVLAGDVSRLDALPPHALDEVDLVLAMFVMHEIYRQRDRAGVVACLSGIAEVIGPAGRLLMVEVSRIEPDRPRPGLRFVPEYQLVHDYSRQRLATQAEWQDMLAEAGLTVLRTEPAGMCEAFCFVAGRP